MDTDSPIVLVMMIVVVEMVVRVLVLGVLRTEYDSKKHSSEYFIRYYG